MTTLPKLDARLSTALPFVRDGAVVADVGTDHAYLPIYLTGSGRASFAVASDINPGPIDRAAAHVAAYGLSDKVKTLRADGLCGLRDDHPTDILIFGMGGELIARILRDAPWVGQAGTRLILQPMTHAEAVRRYLAEQGFATVAEVLSHEGGKIYVTLVADYTGETHALDEAEAAFGRFLSPTCDDPLRVEYLTHRLAVLRAALRGMARAEAATTDPETEATRRAVACLEAALGSTDRKELPL